MSKRLSILGISLILLFFLGLPAFAAGIDDLINSAVQPLTNALSAFIFFEIQVFGAPVKLVVLWLIIAAIFFTLYLGFINLRAFGHALSITRGDYDNPDDPGQVSHFQALMTAISGTVGIGNIAGVAVAISIGGPGAAFWMIMAGFFGMTTKCVECTLGVKYRQELPDGRVSGGPMYTLSRGLAEVRNMPRLGKFLGAFYAVGIVIGCMGIGNMFQSNQAFVQFVSITGGESSWFADKGWLFGIVIALIVGSVIIGGIQRIASVTEKIVPLMAVLYLFFGGIVLLMNASALPGAIQMIVTGAFSGDAVAGGMLGAMMVGFQRAVFSNEAGIGSAAIAHSAVKTNEPVSEGLVSMLEPFIDTIVICTMTAMVVVTTAYNDPSFMTSVKPGIAMTSKAFALKISWFPLPLAVAALLFAFSTMISWSYYGLKGWTYLLGENPRSEMVFKIMYCAFGALGCAIQLGAILDFSDALVFVICIPNLLGLYLLAPMMKRELNDYFARVQSGEIKKYKNVKSKS